MVQASPHSLTSWQVLCGGFFSLGWQLISTFPLMTLVTRAQLSTQWPAIVIAGVGGLGSISSGAEGF